METRAKKMKFEEPAEPETATIDPLIKLHEFHLQELILQHLRGNEVMELMKVSPIWNKILEHSPKAMSKIQFEFDEEASKPSPKEIVKLLNSERRYQNMRLAIRHKANFLLLRRFSLSIVDLYVRIDLKKLRNFSPQNLSFPKLKSLVIRGDANWLITETFKTPKLITLMIASPDPIGEHFDSFLLSVAGSLTELLITCPVETRHIEIVFNQMPKLKSFQCCVIEEINSQLIFQLNHSITKLSLLHHSQHILENLPNLEEYMCGFIVREEVEWIFKNKMKLKTFILSDRFVKPVRNFYQRLKASNATVNQNVKLSYYYSHQKDN
jgi:hypothetical protein